MVGQLIIFRKSFQQRWDLAGQIESECSSKLQSHREPTIRAGCLTEQSSFSPKNLSRLYLPFFFLLLPLFLRFLLLSFNTFQLVQRLTGGEERKKNEKFTLRPSVVLSRWRFWASPTSPRCRTISAVRDIFIWSVKTSYEDGQRPISKKDPRDQTRSRCRFRSHRRNNNFELVPLHCTEAKSKKKRRAKKVDGEIRATITREEKGGGMREREREREIERLSGRDVLVSTHTENRPEPPWPLQCVEELSSSRYLESERVRFI